MQKSFNKIAAALSLVVLSSCGFLSDDDGDKKKFGSSRDAEPPVLIPVERQETVPQLSGARLLRRLSLDVLTRLPSPDEYAVARESDRHLSFVKLFLNSPQAARAIAGLQMYAWQMRSDSLPDLDYFVRSGDTGLESMLTAATRKAIIEEPKALVRYVLEERLPYSTLYRLPFTIAHTDVLTLWGLTSVETPWEGEPLHLATRGSDEPKLGIFQALGLLATIPKKNHLALGTRVLPLLQRIGCTSFANSSVHTFLELTTEELSGDLLLLSANKRECRGCHGHESGLGPAIAGIGLGSTFDNWRQYSGNGNNVEGHYAGQTFTNSEELAESLGSDERLSHCLAAGLASEILQRPLTRVDGRLHAEGVRAFASSNGNLLAYLEVLLGKTAYKASSFTSDYGGSLLQLSTGIRFLTPQMWEGIIAQLLPGNEALSVPAALKSGYSHELDSSHHLPGGSYFHHANRLARQLAFAVVEAELQDDILSQSRYVFRTLPDGAPTVVDEATALEQVAAVWNFLSGYSLETTDAKIATFYALWVAARRDEGDAAAVRGAWQAVLTAMLLHVDFLSL